MSASSKTMQGAFPPSSKETCKIIIVVIMKIRSQTEMTAHKASKKDYVPKKKKHLTTEGDNVAQFPLMLTRVGEIYMKFIYQFEFYGKILQFPRAILPIKAGPIML